MPYYIYRLFGSNKFNNYQYHYIGSTPYPKNRLRQHNGFISGGAKYTHSKLSVLKNNPFNLKWNFQFIIMTFFNKQSALSLEWHLKYPFSTKYNHKKKTRYNIKLNNETFNFRYPALSNDINIMLKQIDITICYFLNEILHNKNLINIHYSKQIIIFFDINIKSFISYKPIHFNIHFFDNFNYSVFYNNVMDNFSKLL